MTDEMRAAYEASSDAAEEHAACWHEAHQTPDGGWAVALFDARVPADPSASVVASAVPDEESAMRQATAANWAVVEEAAGGRVTRPPLTYTSRALRAAMEAGDPRLAPPLHAEEVVMDGVASPFSALPLTQVVRLMEIMQTRAAARQRRHAFIQRVQWRMLRDERDQDQG